MKYYIGIDGGGTKTEFVLAGENGKTLSQLLKGGSNPNDIGIEACAAVLREGISELAKDCAKTDLYIYAGVSGAGVGENAKRIREKLSEYPHVEVASDLMNALEVCLGGSDGIAVICGTGISCSISENGRLKTVGGYGYLFEDGGSGYAYGRDALKAVLRCEDGIGEETVLSEYIYERLQKSVRSSLGEVLRGGKSVVASFCPLVFKGYTAGDKVCEKIIESNLDYTVALIRDALSVSGNMNKLSFIGGVSKEKVFRERIAETFGNGYELRFSEEKPVIGALRLAMKGEKRK